MSPRPPRLHCLIVGAGIGGLTTALALLRAGHSVQVLERATELSDIGAGLQIPPNAARVLDHLGALPRLHEEAVAPIAIETRMGRSGRGIFRIPISGEPWGAPYLHIHRADYVAALSDAVRDLAPDAIRLGARVTRIDQDTSFVSATLDCGQVYTADLLIGADGIHSTVRSALFGQDAPHFTGNRAWRVTVPMEDLGALAPDRTACAWFGPGRHAVTYQLRGGTLANFVGVVETQTEGAEGWQETGDKRDALSDFAGWHPIITNVLEKADPNKFRRWALYDRDPLPEWCVGRITLLGDAAHPMLPFMAQGAAMAVEDAFALVAELGVANSVPQALVAYRDRRFPRTTRMQAASLANMHTFHRRAIASQLASYGPMWLAGHIAPTLIRRRLNWAYAHNETDI